MKTFIVLFLLCAAACGQVECPDGYMAQKQTVVTPSGVVTQPNEYGQLPPGTLRVGENICIRKAGVLEPRPAFENLGNVIGTGGTTDYYAALKIWPLASNKILALTGTEFSGTPAQDFVVQYSDGTWALLAGNGGPTATPGKTQITRSRERTILVTEGNAPRVIADSAIGTTAGSDVTNNKAGLTMPSFVDIQGGDPGHSVSPDAFVSYRAVFRRSDGAYTFQGAVSPAFHYQNSNVFDEIPELFVNWDARSTVVAGDLLEIYRTEEQTDEDSVGDRHRFAFSYTITSTDIANGRAQLFDTCAKDSLGADLYYDGSQEGAAKNNYMPPPSVDVTTFKDVTFYNATQAWHTRSIKAAYVWGALSTTDEISYGIGSRSVSVTTNSTVNMTAASVTGLAVGQAVSGSGIPASTYISAISGSGPYTITITHAATNSTTTARTFVDVIEIDGTKIEVSTWRAFLQSLGDANSTSTLQVVALPSSAVPANSLVVDDTTVTLTLPVSGTGPFTIRATNGQNYSPPLPTMSQTAVSSTADARTNRVYYSKISAPETVSPDAYFTVGHETILRLFATTDTLFAFCSDGIYKIDGQGDNWSVTPFDPDTILLAPDAIDSIDNQIYALTTAGFVSFTDSGGISKISSPLVGNDFRALWKQFQSTDPALPYTWAVQVAADKYRNEVWINFNDTDDDQSAFVKTFIWNTDTNTFTTQTTEQSIGVAYIPYRQSIVVATSSGSPLRVQLRKYSDTLYMSATLEFNPVVGDDIGYLKQWIDTTLLFQTLAGTVTVTPSFEATAYSTPYTLAAGSNFEHVVALLRDYAYNKHCRFGIAIAGTSNWSLLGLTFRYRDVAETLRA